jgi:hypothetical protein
MDPSNQASGDSAARPNDAAVSFPRPITRASQACEMCRLKKTRCDQQNPCSFCKKHSVNCVYSSHKNGKSPSRYSQDERFRRRLRRKEDPATTSGTFTDSRVNSGLRDHEMDRSSGYNATGLGPNPQASEHSREWGSSEVDNGQQADRKSISYY